jgi:hypothetical protein
MFYSLGTVSLNQGAAHLPFTEVAAPFSMPIWRHPSCSHSHPFPHFGRIGNYLDSQSKITGHVGHWWGRHFCLPSRENRQNRPLVGQTFLSALARKSAESATASPCCHSQPHGITRGLQAESFLHHPLRPPLQPHISAESATAATQIRGENGDNYPVTSGQHHRQIGRIGNCPHAKIGRIGNSGHIGHCPFV